jgi:hypothetical protein
MLHHISYEMARAEMAVREREGARMRLVRALKRQRPAADRGA